MSILNKTWQILNQDPSLNVIQKLLLNRGIDKEQVNSYLYPSKKSFHNPFLMKDMEKAVLRIKQAIKNQEKVIIFGDYDVDGISGTAILVKTLKLLGARISYRLPHRIKDGYGLSTSFIEEFKTLEINLIITVDCGISCQSQIALAKTYGIDTIITDHHSIPEIFPDQAHAILHPLQKDCAYPFKGLTGAGVAFKLACALITDHLPGEERESNLFALLDLASLGTIADIGELKDENRLIIKYGLEALKNTKWQGLNHLKTQAGIKPDEKLDVSTIGFKISPRINAAGRIDHPYYSLQLLLQDDEEKGKLLANHLGKLNEDRKLLVTKAMEEAEEQFLNNNGAKIFIAWSKDWHSGILGLIAGKLAEKYSLPCVILQDFGEYLVASVRSSENFNAVEALKAHAAYLESFGGHAQAAGFNIKKAKIEEFKSALENYAKEKLTGEVIKPTLAIDCELEEESISDNLMNFLEQMEPFGTGNLQPLFLVRNVRPLSLKRVGKEQNHLHFQAQIKNKKIPVIGFKFGEHEGLMQQSSTIDLVCYLEKNVWQGRESLQFRAVDFKG